MLFCPGHSNIQFSIYDGAIGLVFEDIVRQKIQLVILLYGKTIDYVLSLRTLIALNGIDGDVVKQLDTIVVDSLTHCCYLIAIRDDDSHGTAYVEACLLLYLVNLHHRGGYHFSFGLVDFIGN